MTTRVLALSDLAQQLAQKESELQEVRRAFESRLADLRRHKEGLETQLQQVDLEIQSATRQNGVPPATPAPATKPEPKRAVESTKSASTLSLPQLIVSIVQKRKGPVTVKDLTQEVKKRKFNSSRGNLPKMIGTRVSDLLKKGLLERPQGQKGVILAQANPAPTVNRAKAKATSTAAKTNGQPAHNSSQERPLSLRALLAELLGKSDRPLKAKELAEQVLAAGYKTKSKKFIDVIWTALGQMENAENIPDQGYRLKRGSKAK